MNELDLWTYWVTGGFAMAASFWAIGAAYGLMRRIVDLTGDE